MEDSTRALIEATSGAVGGLLSTTILYPLDTCKTKYQAESNSSEKRKYKTTWDVFWEALSQRQLGSLYQGLGTKNMQSVIAGFVYFYSYSYVKQKYLLLRKSDSMGAGANLLVAALAGACTAIATQPLDTLSARMQTSSPGQAASLVSAISERGFGGVLDGLGVSLLLTCNPAIQYTVFEQVRDRILLARRKGSTLKGSDPSSASLSALTAFLVGALAKSMATVVTYPLIRCKVLLQREETAEEKEMRAVGTLPPKSVLQAIRILWHTEGVSGFYRGMQAQILKTVLGAALMLMVKEKVAQGSRLTVLAIVKILSQQHTARHKGRRASKRERNIAMEGQLFGISGKQTFVASPNLVSAVAL